MSYSITFHPAAFKEYKNSSMWYEEQQDELGLKFEIAVENKLNQILNSPQLFAISKKPYRQARVAFFPFVIAYRINERKKEIYVSAIHHTSRNPRSKFRRQQ